MKRTIALFLALLFVLTLIPVSALANTQAKFTISYKDASTGAAISGWSPTSFEREADDAGNLLATTNQTITPPKNLQKEVKGVTAAYSPSGASITVNGPAADKTWSLQIDQSATERSIIVSVSYGDPILSWTDGSILGVAYTDGSAVTSGNSVPYNKDLVVTVKEVAGATFAGLKLNYNGATHTVANASATTATFKMPADGATILPIYHFPVTLVTDKGTTLDTVQAAMHDTITLTATAPADQLFTSPLTLADFEVTAGTGTLDSVDGTSNTVTFTLTAMGAATITVKATQLYKLVVTDCSIVSPEDGTNGRKGSYIKDGTVVTVRANEEASAYTWEYNNSIDTGAKDREYTLTMPAATVSISVGKQFPLKVYDVDGNPTTTYYVAGATATASAAASKDGRSFVRWDIEPTSTEVSAKDLTKNPISFNMPGHEVTLRPVYMNTLRLTDLTITDWKKVNSSEPDPSKYSSQTVDGRKVDYWYVSPGTTVTLSTLTPTDGDGEYQLSHWKVNNSSQPISGNTFTMPADNVEIESVWRTYTLTVRRYVNSSIVETYVRRPGQSITLTAQTPTSGTRFNYWTHSAGLLMTVNDVDVGMDNPRTERITVKMGSGDAWVTANYLPNSDLSYLYTGAYIQMIGEPVRHYALLEYFRTDGMTVYYYPDRGSAGGPVDNSQLVCQVVKPGTNEVVTAADGAFITTGDFELLITFYVNGVKMADTIRVLNTPSTYIHVYSNRPEYVAAYSPNNVLRNSVYYPEEKTTSINKDGLVATLVSADHTTGVYFTGRELSQNEYDLVAYNPLEAKYTAGNVARGKTEIPSTADIEKAVTSGVKGYKKVDGKYYMQLAIEYYDQAQLDSTGKPTLMTYVDQNPSDFIWIEVGVAATGHGLDNFVPSTEVTLPTATYPTYSWELKYSAIAQSRSFDLIVTGLDNLTKAEQAAAINWTNEDPSVAVIQPSADNPLHFTLVPRTVGVTTFTFTIRGTDKKVTLEVTVKDDVGLIDMDTLSALNKSEATLYVGNKITLYPVQFTPYNADTTMKWEVAFTDDGTNPSPLQPENAKFYVNVDPTTGVVEALKYTDRKILVTGTAVNYSDKTKPAPSASCVITIGKIDVFSMTLYPVELDLYRMASYPLSAKMAPEAATDKKVNWTSSNSSIVSVDNEGVITAHMLGTATIQATSNSNPEIYKTCVVNVKQSVLLTEITLNRTSATLGVGDTTALTVYYTPSTATTQSVTWTSSDPSVATVDANGKVRGVSEGVAIIIGTANDGSGKRAACTVSVSTIVASAVVLNKQTLAMVEGESETLTATVYPTNVSAKGITWTSSNPSVATVDYDGTVTGTGGGSVIITATSNDASARYADCVVVVTPRIPVTGLALNLSSFDLLLNDTTTLVASVSPANATEKVTWSSNNTSVATVDENGRVSGLSMGSAVITAKAGMKSISVTVSVVSKMYSTGTVVNCARRVNVRGAASGSSKLVGYAYLGDTYKVLDKSGNWFKIQYNATTTAYIWSRYLNATETTAGYISSGPVGSTTPAPGTTPTPTPVASKTVTIINCQNSVNVRSGAGTSFSKLGLAYLNETFTYTGVTTDTTGGTWYAVDYHGTPSYISGSFIRVN